MQNKEPLFDTTKPESEEKTWYQNIYKNYHAAQFIKNVVFDGRDFWSQFIVGLLEETYLGMGESKEKIRPAIRFGMIGKFKATKAGVVAVGKVQQFPPEQKVGLSKKQPVSVLSVEKNYYPPVFNSTSTAPSVGVMLFSENIEGNSNVMPSIIMKYDGGTMERRYHFPDEKSAEEYLTQQKQEGFWHESIDSLINSGFDSDNHNEILARIKWDINNPACHIGIFTDTLKSRLVAQLRATDLKINTKQQFIPTSFYISTNEAPKDKIFPYYLQEQKKDLTTALNSQDENIKTIALIVDFLNRDQATIDFDNMQQCLQKKIWSLLLDEGKLTNITRKNFLEKFLAQSQLIDFKDAANNKLLEKCILLATASGQEILVANLLQNFPPASKDEIIKKLVKIAIYTGQESVTKLFFNQHNLDPNMVVDDKENNLLHLAVKFGHANIVQIILDQGADINIPNEAGDSAIMIASSYGFANVVQRLLHMGAIPDLDNSNGETALMLAAQNGNADVVEILLNNKGEGSVNCNLTNNDGNTSLILAVQKTGNIRVVEQLLVAGADPNLANDNGDTPLGLATQLGESTMVELLVAYKAIVPAKKYDNNNEKLIRLPSKKNSRSSLSTIAELLDEIMQASEQIPTEKQQPKRSTIILSDQLSNPKNSRPLWKCRENKNNSSGSS